MILDNSRIRNVPGAGRSRGELTLQSGRGSLFFLKACGNLYAT